MHSIRFPDLNRVLANIIFIAEVFADRRDEELPVVPFLELAKSFELATGAPSH